MSSGFELLGGILNIAQILSVINRHVQGFRRLEAALKNCEECVKQIENKIHRLNHLHALDGLQSEILEEAIQEFESICQELIAIQDKVVNRSYVRKILLAPEILEKLNDITSRLAKKDDTLKLLGMIGAFNAEHRSNCAQIFNKLKSMGSSASSPEGKLEEFCQMKVVVRAVKEITKQTKGYSMNQMTGFIHLSTGVCLYKAEFRVQNYEVAAQHFNSAVRMGWSQGYYYLGMLYKSGLGVEKCNITAKNFFQYGTDAGVPAAMSELGQCYDEGIGVERDPVKAVEFVKRGVAGNDPRGYALYAYYNLHGHNIAVNTSRGFKMAKKASESNLALNNLAKCYIYGIGVERDPSEAFKLLLKNAEVKESWLAYLYLARLYEKGIGVQANLEKMAEFYKKGTELLAWQRPYYQGYYGLYLIRGIGVREDKKSGWKMIQRSIQSNNAAGWYTKGECYRFGYGVEPDIVKAVRCYKRAIQMESGMDGKIKAKFALGCMFELGQGGLSQNFQTAFEHFNFAANRMHQEAQWKIGIFCESGTGTDRFEDRAVHYFQLAANSGHRQAQLKAGMYYMQGKGVSRDLHKAIDILTSAAQNGDREARRKLRLARLQVLFQRDRPVRTRTS